VRALGVGLTSVRRNGQWLTVEVGVDATNGLVLTVDVLPNAKTETLTAWVGELADAARAAAVVSDDADGFKAATDERGRCTRSARSTPWTTPRAWSPS
jgi:hypothetical protein